MGDILESNLLSATPRRRNTRNTEEIQKKYRKKYSEDIQKLRNTKKYRRYVKRYEKIIQKEIQKKLQKEIERKYFQHIQNSFNNLCTADTMLSGR